MVIPTREFDPLLADGYDFQAQMITYIRKHFAKRLGRDIELLDLPDGIELLAEKHGLLYVAAETTMLAEAA